MACEVLIFGSCVSRDIFNFDSAGNFNLVDYYARQSFGSLVGQSYSNDAVLQRISSDFRRRMVARDFAKSILQADSAIARADVILLDLIDERFDLLLLPTGHVLTYSAELAESKFLDEAEASGYQRLKPGSKERRAYWLEGVERFFSWLQANGKRPAVLVNKVYWSTRIEPAGTAGFAVSQEAIFKANAELDWMYMQLRRWVSADQFMSFAPDSLVADAGHRWGVAPFHYIQAYYQAASDQIMHRYRVQADSRNVCFWEVNLGANEEIGTRSPASRVQLQSLLLAEIESRQQELDALRSSIRFRLGDVMLQVLPLSWRSLQVLPRLYALFRTHRRNQGRRSRPEPTTQTALTSQALGASVIYYGKEAVEGVSAACSFTDPVALVARLDMAPVSQLILRDISEPIARRLGRLQLQECRIIWWPSVPEADDPLQQYVRSLADECRYGVFP